ncbi:hypothetical protein DVR12_16100 [Chitinophaga silvatica]|uniref:Lipocalin-like domain-containing protein n=1 Tax=Chitinophaga silvatica TaxID=2282649 RepID=A0A3E1Y8X5_9BACT|nr:hypothetical protein [Chitinophaga silvatica]RFS21419.1 hypothetical protein DVR12_16100 [Chitinophaga silvatica]
MNFKNAMLAAALILSGCATGSKNVSNDNSSPLTGTWRLVESTTKSGARTRKTYPVAGQEAIRIYNGSHYSFFRHNTPDSYEMAFASGAGTYTLKGEDFQEHLIYCDVRRWEDQILNYKVTFIGDTMKMFSPKFSTEDVFVRMTK